MSRFEPFTDAELAEIWDGLTMDDGIRCGFDVPAVREPEAEDPANYPVDYLLACELHAEAEVRGLDDVEPERWGSVLT